MPDLEFFNRFNAGRFSGSPTTDNSITPITVSELREKPQLASANNMTVELAMASLRGAMTRSDNPALTETGLRLAQNTNLDDLMTGHDRLAMGALGLRPSSMALTRDMLDLHVRPADRWWSTAPKPATDKAYAEFERDITLLDGTQIKMIRVAATQGNNGQKTADKSFWAQDKAGTLQAFANIEQALLPLYANRLVEEFAEQPNSQIILTEGVAAADAIAKFNLPAFGTITGALATPSAEALRVLAGKSVLLWPDNDDEGLSHMAKIAMALRQIGVINTRVLKWQDGPQSADASNFQGSTADLGKLIKHASIFKPDQLSLLTVAPKISVAASPLRLRP